MALRLRGGCQAMTSLPRRAPSACPYTRRRLRESAMAKAAVAAVAVAARIAVPTGSGTGGGRLTTPSAFAIAGIVMPLRAVCRRALRTDALTVNPTANLELPEAAGTRDRVATAEEAEVLLSVLPEEDRPL